MVRQSVYAGAWDWIVVSQIASCRSPAQRLLLSEHELVCVSIDGWCSVKALSGQGTRDTHGLLATWARRLHRGITQIPSASQLRYRFLIGTG